MKELEKNELREVDGGRSAWVTAGLALFAALVTDWENFERGLCGKPYKENNK
jgi:lactobin A/cerein 7B family class IIb bacteriocin